MPQRLRQNKGRRSSRLCVNHISASASIEEGIGSDRAQGSRRNRRRRGSRYSWSSSLMPSTGRYNGASESEWELLLVKYRRVAERISRSVFPLRRRRMGLCTNHISASASMEEGIGSNRAQRSRRTGRPLRVTLGTNWEAISRETIWANRRSFGPAYRRPFGPVYRR
jgi:hypothetical protein